MSDTPGTGASVESVDGSAMLTSESENSAQQIAQHERSTGAVGVGFSEAPAGAGSDLGLRLLVDAWSTLPDSVKSQILKLANNAVPGAR